MFVETKKLYLVLILFLALFSIIIPNILSPNNTPAESASNKENTALMIYHNEIHGYSFEIPKKWEGTYAVYEHKNKTSFVYIGCPNEKADFFSIVTWTKKDFENHNELDPGLNKDILGATNEFVFLLNKPLDLPFDDINNMKIYGEEYGSMSLSIREISKRFHVAQ